MTEMSTRGRRRARAQGRRHSEWKRGRDYMAYKTGAHHVNYSPLIRRPASYFLPSMPRGLGSRLRLLARRKAMEEVAIARAARGESLDRQEVMALERRAARDDRERDEQLRRMREEGRVPGDAEPDWLDYVISTAIAEASGPGAELLEAAADSQGMPKPKSAAVVNVVPKPKPLYKAMPAPWQIPARRERHARALASIRAQRAAAEAIDEAMDESRMVGREETPRRYSAMVGSSGGADDNTRRFSAMAGVIGRDDGPRRLSARAGSSGDVHMQYDERRDESTVSGREGVTLADGTRLPPGQMPDGTEWFGQLQARGPRGATMTNQEAINVLAGIDPRVAAPKAWQAHTAAAPPPRAPSVPPPVHLRPAQVHGTGGGHFRRAAVDQQNRRGGRPARQWP